MTTPYRVVVAVIANPDRTRILAQRKDETYREPLALALFGGHVEPGESDLQALQRELVEELGADSAQILFDAGLQHVHEFDLGYPFVLFDVIVPDETLRMLAARPVFEGKCAEIVSNYEVFGWMIALVDVMIWYVSRPSGPPPTRGPRS